MRKIYQSSWHGIPFGSFTDVSTDKLADPHFYESFYKLFFKKHRAADDLDPEWVRLKTETIQHLERELFASKDSRILSIGCGLGLMETQLYRKGYSHIEVTETSENALQWVQKLLPAAQIHVGSFPDALPPNLRYDSILLSSVDYFLNENELASTLQQARARLNNGGNCTLISWSFDKGGWSSLVQTWRERMEAILEQLSLHARRQFWGYRRNREEYHRAFTKSGFIHLIDEIIDTQTPWETYRITGHLT